MERSEPGDRCRSVLFCTSPPNLSASTSFDFVYRCNIPNSSINDHAQVTGLPPASEKNGRPQRPVTSGGEYPFAAGCALYAGLAGLGCCRSDRSVWLFDPVRDPQ